MDSLLYRPWWEEEDFARRLNLPIRPVRQILRLLETHFLVAREHRKEKRRKPDSDGGGGPHIEGDVVDESNQERGNLISYCSLDYQQIFDMARYRIFRIQKKLKEELEDKRALQEYLCPSCGKTYTTLEAPFLIKPDGLFHCEECDAVLKASQEGLADGMSRQERRKAVKAKQAKVSEELKPLMVLLAEIEKKLASGQEVPDFGTLTAWAESEARRTGVRNDGSPSAAQRAEPQINISLGGPEASTGSGAAAPRQLPPWLLKQNAGAEAASLSYSLSQEVSGDLKDAKDIESASLETVKQLQEHALTYALRDYARFDQKPYRALAQEEAMRQYKERMAQIASQNGVAKRQRTADGWQEVKPEAEAAAGWQEVAAPPPAPKPEIPKAAAVKKEPLDAQEAEHQEGASGDEWEDA